MEKCNEHQLLQIVLNEVSSLITFCKILLNHFAAWQENHSPSQCSPTDFIAALC